MRSGAHATHFRHRQRADGRVEIYCPWCSTVVGSADNIEGLSDAAEYRCRCETLRPETSRLVFHRWLYSAAGDSDYERINAWRQCSLLVIALGLFYILPTVLEIVMMDTWGPWLAVVGLGDLLGCLCVALVFRKPRLALAIYLATTVVEVLLYHFRLIPSYLLPLLADFAPTTAVLACIWACPSEVPAQAPRKS